LENEAHGREYVINGFVAKGIRNEEPALRGSFDAVARRAGIPNKIPRPFDNMRASRSNELRRNPNIGVKMESIWLGHTQEVADSHYFFMSRGDYEAAAAWETPDYLLAGTEPKLSAGGLKNTC
jgi:hypothetical protein